MHRILAFEQEAISSSTNSVVYSPPPRLIPPPLLYVFSLIGKQNKKMPLLDV